MAIHSQYRLNAIRLRFWIEASSQAWTAARIMNGPAPPEATALSILRWSTRQYASTSEVFDSAPGQRLLAHSFSRFGAGRARSPRTAASRATEPPG